MRESDLLLVHLVDDDDAVRRSAGFMLRTSGYDVRPYGSGTELLKKAPGLETGCILLDIRMPGMDGLEIQAELHRKGCTLPVIIMTGHGDVGLAVRAMKEGAVDFIEKPFGKSTLLAAIELGMEQLRQTEIDRDRTAEAAVRLQLLTPREKEVLDGLADGLPNKSIAFDLGISPRTVEIHRANLMNKLGARSLSEVLRIAFAAQSPAPPAQRAPARPVGE